MCRALNIRKVNLRPKGEFSLDGNDRDSTRVGCMTEKQEKSTVTSWCGSVVEH